VKTRSLIRAGLAATIVVTAMATLSAHPAAARGQGARQGAKQGGRQATRQAPPQNPDAVAGKNGLKSSKPAELTSPAYVQQMFDTMAVVEADKFLPLSGDQYPVFVQHLRRVQEARAQANRRRAKALNELRGLVGPNAPADVTDSVIDAKLKELIAAEQEGAADVRKALDDLDAGLSVRQRARYRLLEENVERRKIDFLTKVRGGGQGPGF
jgi:hypothetical protein